jgi:hypothetical protein
MITEMLKHLAELLEIASDEVDEHRQLNGLPPLNNIGRWEHKLAMKRIYTSDSASKESGVNNGPS